MSGAWRDLEARRQVREAADRAYFHHQLAAEGRQGHADPDRSVATSVVAERRAWSPTVAECRFMSRDEVNNRWTAAVRTAAGAVFPKKTVALGRAADLAAYFVTAGRLEEDRVMEHLRRAAKKAGVGPQETERVITRSFSQGLAHALGQVDRGGVEGDLPGAFRAVACAADLYHHELGMSVEPWSLLPLPVGTLVYLNHDFRDTEPVAVAVPRFEDGVIAIEAVFRSASYASPAGDCWTLLRRGRLPAVSIYAHAQEFHRCVNGRLVRGVLTSVDLVETPRDERATVTEIVAAKAMTPAQRRVQSAFDCYIANGSPTALDFLSRADSQGATALDVLAPVVAPLRAERGGSAVAVSRGA